MKEIMKELERLAGLRPMDIIQKKQKGSKVVEYFGDFVPEQWIAAAGAESYLICKGGNPQPVEATLDYMLRFINPLSATMAGSYLLDMDPVMPIADSVVIQQCDCHYSRISELLEFKGVPVFKVGVPADYTAENSRDYYRYGLKQFRAKLEELVGHPIDDDAIRANYAKTNKINELLRKINEYRKRDNAPITFSDFIKLNHYSFHVDYDKSIDALTRICQKLENAPGVHPENAPRLLIMGRAVAAGDYIVPTILERAGGSIVCEILDEAIRPYNCDISTEGDVVEAYASAMYDKRLPICLFQPAWKTRLEHVKKLVEEYRIDGVIWYQLAFEEIYDMEYACVAKKLAECNIPVLKLETSYEYSREAMAPLTTRLESFVETLKEEE